MWIRIMDKDDSESCINLDYITCIFQTKENIRLIFSDGSFADVKVIQGYTYDSLCELLTKRP